MRCASDAPLSWDRRGPQHFPACSTARDLLLQETIPALAALRCAWETHRGRPHILMLLALLLLLSFVVTAQAQGLECRGAQKPQQVAELMFGRKGGDRIGVSEVEWARFLDREITARFPDGLTVLTGAGQWRDQVSKKIV